MDQHGSLQQGEDPQGCHGKGQGSGLTLSAVKGHHGKGQGSGLTLGAVMGHPGRGQGSKGAPLSVFKISLIQMIISTFVYMYEQEFPNQGGFADQVQFLFLPCL